MSRIVDSVADRLGGLLGTHTGELQEIDGHKFLPVSLIAGGFGGGSVKDDSVEGASSEDSGQASGGGGGGVAIPLGIYRVDNDDDELTFEPNPIVLLASALPVIAVTGCTVRAIIKALKRK